MNVQMIELEKLKPYEKNPRDNSKAVEAVKESIRVNGFNQPIVCDQDYVICVGHTRYQAAYEMGMKKVPVYKKRMTKAQFKAYLIADNKTHEFSKWNDELLGELLKEITEDGDSEKEIEMLLGSTGFSEKELESLIDTDEIDEVVEEVDVAAHKRLVGNEKKKLKQVQIFLEAELFEQFISNCEQIQTYMKTDSMTDTIYNAVERVADEIKGLNVKSI